MKFDDSSSTTSDIEDDFYSTFDYETDKKVFAEFVRHHCECRRQPMSPLAAGLAQKWEKEPSKLEEIEAELDDLNEWGTEIEFDSGAEMDY